jgi:hypothetical protein
MARKTKAELAAEREAYAASQQAVARATYTDRMMAVFERANRVNFELQVRAGVFVLEDRDDRGKVFMLASEWTLDSDEWLQDLEWRVESKEEAQAEAERRLQVRRAALAKLSQEEREELGL